MATSAAAGSSGRETPTERRRRGRVSPGGLLDAALRLVDEAGLEALSMRQLGARLGVEAMSLYRYVPSKEALLDRLAERLWAQVPLPDRATGWRSAARSTAWSLRRLAHDHPHAFPLLLSRPVLPESALRVFDRLLTLLREAGFDERPAGQALGSLVAYAVGYGMVELTCGLGRSDLAARRCLPSGTGERFAGVARALGQCDPEAQFAFGLGTLLNGLSGTLRRRGGTGSPARGRGRAGGRRRSPA